jgi:hypothetical protein
MLPKLFRISVRWSNNSLIQALKDFTIIMGVNISKRTREILGR